MVIPTTGRVRLAGARDYKAPSHGLAGQARRACSVYKRKSAPGMRREGGVLHSSAS